MKKTFRPHPKPGATRVYVPESKSNSGKQRINEDINEPEIRVIDEQGNMLGLMSSRKALEIAVARELDLIEIAPTAKPPVCKIMDYGKFQYEMQKKEKHQRKHQQQQQMKEIRFKWRTATHDFNFKVRHARDFIEEGNKVKASVMFRGREITHQEVGHELLTRFVEALKDIAKVDQQVQSEGRFISVVMAPDKIKKPKKPEDSEKPEQTEKQENSVKREKTVDVK